MPAQTYKLSKGLNQKPDPEISDGVTECTDLLLDKIGSMRSRRANSTYLALASPATSMSWEANSAGDQFLYGSGTSAFSFASEIKTGLSGSAPSFTSYLNHSYFLDKTHGLFSYDAAVYSAGAPAPGTAVTAVAGAAGSLTGTYSFKVTFFNGNGFDGNPSSATDVVLASQKASLSAIPIYAGSAYNITGRKIWILGGTSPSYSDYSLAATINDNTTTTATIDASNVDTTILMEDDNGVALPGYFLVEHYGVLFLVTTADLNLVQFSKAAEPESWPILNALRIGKSGDPIMNLIKWNDALWVPTRRRIYQMLGSPGQGSLLTNFYIKESQAQKGTIASQSIQGTPYGMFYLAEDGLRKFGGEESEVFSNEIEDELNQLSTDPTVQALACSAYGQDKYFLSFAQGSATANTVTAIYDFKRGEWTMHGKGYQSFAVDRKTNTVYGGTTSANIETFEAGTGYSAYAVSKVFTQGVEYEGVWGKFQIDMVGAATAYAYLDDVLSQTYSISNASRALTMNRLPAGLANRLKIRLVGTAQATQNIIYSISPTGDIGRSKV